MQASVSADLQLAFELRTALSSSAAGDSPLIAKYLTLVAPATLAVNFGKGTVLGVGAGIAAAMLTGTGNGIDVATGAGSALGGTVASGVAIATWVAVGWTLSVDLALIPLTTTPLITTTLMTAPTMAPVFLFNSFLDEFSGA